jgi:hypothetical protein
MQFVFGEVHGYYNTQIAETRLKHSAEDNPDLKQQRLSKELEGLKKLKGARYQ